MKPLYLPSTLRELENLEARKLGLQSSRELIPIAVQQLFEFCLPLLEKLSPQKIVLLEGPGNNGADGRGLYEKLQIAFKDKNLQWLTINTHSKSDLDLSSLASDKILILDAVFGSGFKGPELPVFWRSIFDLIKKARIHNPYSLKVWAIDSPSGLDCQKGRPAPGTLPADQTLSLGFSKYSHYLPWLKPWIGKLDFLNLNFENSLETCDVMLLEKTDLPAILPKRVESNHKGSWSRVEILAGSKEFPGACYLASLGAFKVGASYVYVPNEVFSEGNFLQILPEVIPGPAPTTSPRVRAVGPGWGLSPSNMDFLKNLLSKDSSDFEEIPQIFDADALVLLSQIPQAPSFFRNLKKIHKPVLFTPHPGEALALLGETASKSTTFDPKDRLQLVSELQKKWGEEIVFILKGSGNLIAQHQKKYLSRWGSVAMANAGHGDLLTGILAGLLAQGLSGLEAALCGLAIQGLSAEALMASPSQTTGILAHEVGQRVPMTLAELNLMN